MSTPNKRERESDDDSGRDVAPRLKENAVICQHSSGENMLGSVGIPRRLEDVIGAYHHKDIIPNKKLMPILFQNYKKNVNVGNSERQNQNEGKNSCAD